MQVPVDKKSLNNWVVKSVKYFDSKSIHFLHLLILFHVPMYKKIIFICGTLS